MAHAIIRPRWISAITYLLYSFAGASFIFLPNSGLKDLLGPVGFVVWNMMLSTGGFLGLIGVARKSSPIELVGLPGVITGLTVYSIYLFRESANSSSPGIIIGIACLLLASAVSMCGRVYEVHSISKISARVSRRIREEGGEE